MKSFDKSDITQFYAHHVGGRAGSVSFPDLPKFEEDIVNVIYEADESCLEQIEDIWKGKKAIVLPYCLADKCGQANFNINYCPYTSSLLPLNINYGNFYHKNDNYDYVYEFVLKTQKIIKINTTTIDSLVENGKVSPPDFLSIDTQGAELQILMGAMQCLVNNTVAVLVEINFTTLYENAPLFGKLDEFLRSKDFLLAEIKPFNIGYKRIPEDLRGKGIPLQGEALYLLRPSAVRGSDIIKLSMKLEKLAFAACAFGYTELAYEALERSPKIAHNDQKARLYQKFLYELFSEMNSYTKIPPLWHEIYSFDDSNNRFVKSDKEGFIKDNLPDSLNVFPWKVVKFTIRKVFSFIKKIFLVFRIQISFIPRHSVIPRQNPFEAFLIKNDFRLAAFEISERRKSGL